MFCYVSIKLSYLAEETTKGTLDWAICCRILITLKYILLVVVVVRSTRDCTCGVAEMATEKLGITR